MALIPLVELDHLAALLGIRPWHTADDADLAVLRDLLTRRQDLAAAHQVADPPPAGPPYRRLLH